MLLNDLKIVKIGEEPRLPDLIGLNFTMELMKDETTHTKIELLEGVDVYQAQIQVWSRDRFLKDTPEKKVREKLVGSVSDYIYRDAKRMVRDLYYLSKSSGEKDIESKALDLLAYLSGVNL